MSMSVKPVPDTQDDNGNVGLSRPTLTLDVALYEAFLADEALDEQQRQQLIETFWSVVVGFVDLGFRVEPAPVPADKSGGIGEEFACAGFALLPSKPDLTTNPFEKAAVPPASAGD